MVAQTLYTFGMTFIVTANMTVYNDSKQADKTANRAAVVDGCSKLRHASRLPGSIEDRRIDLIERIRLVRTEKPYKTLN